MDLQLAYKTNQPSEPLDLKGLLEIYYAQGNIANLPEPGIGSDFEDDFKLGLIHIERGDWRQALNAFKKVVARRPTLFEAHYNLAIVYFNLNLHQENTNFVIEAIKH